MTQFIQLHMLTAYPPSNLNRDDLGRPKTAIVGGTERLRISSQSLKRAWRTSEHFQDALSDFQGTRTKRLGEKVYQHLIDKEVTEKLAAEWSSAIAGAFGKVKKDKPMEIEQLAHVSPEEWSAVMALAATLATENRAPEDKELALLRATPKAVDIALFGRMLASSPAYNVEAAAQVSHAFTVNPVKIEDDFFTAVDDLNSHEEDAGAGHMGDAGFGSGVFYLYCCINKDLLVNNLQNDEALAKQTITALLQSAATVAPTGKQNSFASRAYTSYLLAEKGSQQPRSLSVAFLQAARGGNPLDLAIKSLETQRSNFETAYGACADGHKTMNVQNGEGSLADIIQFVTE
ncbi:MAG: type I-E CRISPR-associated protein Cas7/Cse4/CasC [Pseudomonadales bacterium]|nr:type I-E CRISPR-associated protein Cas7/Cse4/CasC [Pseudomonadales bacterium]